MNLFYSLFILVLLSSCEVKFNKEEPKKEKETRNYERNTSKIRNGIVYETTGGLVVDQAFLTYDDGSLVAEDNITELKRPLKLRLVIDGWENFDDKVYLEGEQIVSTDTGSEIIALRNLFSRNGIEVISPDEAKYINLDVVINKVNRLIDYFKVDFRIWNKKNDQSVKGSYKFHINEM